MVQTQKSAETRPRCNFPESRIGFSRHNQLSWTPTKRLYGWHRIFWCNSSTSPHTCLSSVCQHHAEITQSHTIAALIRLSTTTHNILTFNTSEISLKITRKNSAYCQINAPWLFSYTRLIQVRGCRVTRSADQHSPCFQTRKKLSLGPCQSWQSSPAILLSPNSFDS